MFVLKDKGQAGGLPSRPHQSEQPAGRSTGLQHRPVARHRLAAIVAENAATQSSQEEEEEAGEPTGSQMIHEVPEGAGSQEKRTNISRSDRRCSSYVQIRPRETIPPNSLDRAVTLPQLDKTNRQFCQTEGESERMVAAALITLALIVLAHVEGDPLGC